VTAEPFTVALKICVAPAGIAMTAGLICTPCAAETFRVAVPVRLEPAEEVAVTVTIAGLDGAVYAPLLLLIVPPPVTLQVNVEVGWLGRNAVNCTFPLIGTLATAG
jgi:hypothetical protein